MVLFAAPGQPGSTLTYESRYGNWIDGGYVRSTRAAYFADTSPVTGQVFTELCRSTEADVRLAVAAATSAAPAWAGIAPGERAGVLHRVADRIEQNLQALAVAETWETGRPIREVLAADLPIAIDQWRYCAGALRAQQGGISEIDSATVAYHFREPLGVVGLRAGSEFPLLTAGWQLAPALAAGNTVVLAASERTPASIHVLLGLIGDLLPPGVLNVLNGVAADALDTVPFATASGRCPAIFFSDVLRSDDDFQDKTLEGFAMFALNQETGLSAALVEKSAYDEFLELATIRTKAIQQGDPLDTETMIGALPSADHVSRALAAIEGKVVVGGERAELDGALAGGFYLQPTVIAAGRDVRHLKAGTVGPVVTVAAFDQPDDAVRLANSCFSGSGAAVWTRDVDRAYRTGRRIAAERVWTNCYHRYPAHAALSGRHSYGGDGRAQVLERYQRSKDLLVSYDPRPVGIF
ncbi:aldehyde dehydrogenase family protein [Fodinicola acaciae]|uniref:aldehyde dehydrogenase family protein n=1 Tax=Fodinicola acaciae TaxID=2681555 RepID=UPI0013D0A551|nr:aldehyde dehydrogenase family protein [Fodinicola acaciae]